MRRTFVGRLRAAVAAVVLAVSVAALTLAGTVVPAWAANETEWELDGDTLHLNADEQGTCPGHRVTGSRSGSKIEISGGTHRIILDSCSITPSITSSGIDISGNADVTLELVGENEAVGRNGHPAIWVDEGSSLTIEGPGSLRATVEGVTMGSAAIGGVNGADTSFGSITINSGSVYAESIAGGAGIGGGYHSGSGNTSGSVTINGGYVVAKGGGGSGGSGIGAGSNASFVGTVTINGGVVYAEGGHNSVSIGAGGRDFGDLGHGTFGTGQNGNAVIVAPQGIGASQNFADWDGIFVSYEGTENTATAALDQSGNLDTVTLNDGEANIQVWGTPEIDYNLTVSQNATLRVVCNDSNDAPSSLIMDAGSVLTNNGTIVVGRMGGGSDDSSTLVLWGGVEKTAGAGAMNVAQNAAVKILLTEDLVTLTGADDLVYNGTTQQPTVSVRLSNLWGYSSTFDEGVDYACDMPDSSVDAGDYEVVLSAKGRHRLDRATCWAISRLKWTTPSTRPISTSTYPSNGASRRGRPSSLRSFLRWTTVRVWASAPQSKMTCPV